MTPQSFANSVKDASKEINPPNLLLWGIFPTLFVFLIILKMAFALGLTVTGTSTATVCKKTSKGKKCSDQEISNFWKLVVLIFVALLVSITVGMSCYKLGIMYLNPKIGVGMFIVGEVADTIRGQ